MISRYTYLLTINAICGLIRNRKEVKELLCPYGEVFNKETAMGSVKAFCIEHNLSLDSEYLIELDNYNKDLLDTFNPDFERVLSVAIVIAESE